MFEACIACSAIAPWRDCLLDPPAHKWMSSWWVTTWVSWIPLDTWIPGCLAKPVDAIPWSKWYCLLAPADSAVQRDRQVNATAVSHRDHYIVLVEPLVAQLVVLAPVVDRACSECHSTRCLLSWWGNNRHPGTDPEGGVHIVDGRCPTTGEYLTAKQCHKLLI